MRTKTAFVGATIALLAVGLITLGILESIKSEKEGRTTASPPPTEMVDHEKSTKRLSQHLYKLSGKVLDATPDISDEVLSGIAATGDEKAVGKLIAPKPVSNAVVFLKDGTVSLQAHTDSEGNFEFPRLQMGYYEISCEHPTELFGKNRMATGMKRIDIGFEPYRTVSHRTITLEIHADRVTIEGRITDINGRPVAGAKVIGKHINVPEPTLGITGDPDQVVREEFSVVSAADGSYVLRGFEPTRFFFIQKYLVRGKTHADVLDYAEIHVAFPPLTLEHAQVKMVPLVTEEGLAIARRFLPAMMQHIKLLGDPTEYKEQKDLAFPSSYGTTITGVNIVLERAGPRLVDGAAGIR